MLENGKAYSNYSKHLLYLSDFAKAEEMLVNAINIFSKILDDSHPSTWDVKYLTNLFKLKTQIKKNP